MKNTRMSIDTFLLIFGIIWLIFGIVNFSKEKEIAFWGCICLANIYIVGSLIYKK